MFAEFDAACTAFAKELDLPGLAAGLVEQGKLVHATSVGLADLEAKRPVTADTSFRIASMTKNVTALAVLALRDAGKLALDAPYAQYVPQFARVPLPTRDSPPLTLRHLLSHLGGQVYDDPWGDRVLGMSPNELDAVMAAGKLFARPPGMEFEYSNLGYGLIGRAITNVSGMPYQRYIARTIFEPLGMTRTTFDALAASKSGDYAWPYRLDDNEWSRERLEPDGEVGAMGGIATTVNDYARYVAFILSAWPARDDPDTGPVRRSSVREMGTFHAPPFAPDPLRPVPAGAYGYGFNNALDPKLGRLLHHGGGLPGYGSYVLMQPDRGLGVFGFANRTYAPMSRLCARLLDLAHAARPAPPLPVASRAVVRAVEALVLAYNAGSIETAKSVLAVNFLPDTPARFRDRELAELKAKLGEGRIEKIEGVHALEGRFTLVCEKGRIAGSVQLSPEKEPGIQRLTLSPLPSP
jgi:CubicO group peptidase (beta-lactamase class C family)